MSTPEELNLSIVTYETLIKSYEKARERILERRRSATDSTMVELDERLAANQRTFDSLRRAVEMTHEQLKILGLEPGGPTAGHSRPPRGVRPGQ